MSNIANKLLKQQIIFLYHEVYRDIHNFLFCIIKKYNDRLLHFIYILRGPEFFRMIINEHWINIYFCPYFSWSLPRCKHWRLRTGPPCPRFGWLFFDWNFFEIMYTPCSLSNFWKITENKRFIQNNSDVHIEE